MASQEEKNVALVADETQLPGSPKSVGHSSDDDAPIDPKAERKLLAKLDLCIYPPLFIIYMMSFLDRINISNAKILGMTDDIPALLEGSNFNIALFVSTPAMRQLTPHDLRDNRSTSCPTSSWRCRPTF